MNHEFSKWGKTRRSNYIFFWINQKKYSVPNNTYSYEELTYPYMSLWRCIIETLSVESLKYFWMLQEYLVTFKASNTQQIIDFKNIQRLNIEKCV